MFLFKQKTAYEMRISDWSSDVCSSDLKNHFSDQGEVTSRRSGSSTSSVKRAPDSGARFLAVYPLFSGAPDLAALSRVDARFIGRCQRSEERRVGKECVSTCRARGSRDQSKKKHCSRYQRAYIHS